MQELGTESVFGGLSGGAVAAVESERRTGSELRQQVVFCLPCTFINRNTMLSGKHGAPEVEEPTFDRGQILYY
jgi:hypothetical protein